MQPNDGQLLARFLQNRDEHAFEELVQRHASMVMVSCKRILGDGHDTEEAFQNTFLVLVRKAGLHLQAESVAGWLYNVAARTALDMRGKRLTQASRFVGQEKIEMIPRTEEISAAWEAMKGLLDEELIQLADKYRQPLVLCYLEGKNTEQAAQDLGLSYSALKVRLMRGRELLRKRLVRRGVAVSAGALAAILLEQSAKAAEVVSEVLIQSTVTAAMSALSAVTTAGMLAGGWKGVLLAMKIKTTAAIIGGLVFLGLIGSVPFLLSNTKRAQPVRSQISLPVLVKEHIVVTQKLATVKEGKKTSILQMPAQNVQAVKEEPADSATNVLQFASVKDFLLSFRLAVFTSDPAQRWQAFRDMGINLSNEDFARVDALIEAYLERFPSGKFTSQDISEIYQSVIFNEWLKKDPVSVLNWSFKLKNLPPQDEISKKTKGQYGVSYLYKMVFKDGKYEYQLDPDGDICHSHGDTQGEVLFSAFLKMWTAQDPQAALMWASNLPDEQERQSALKVTEVGKKIYMALTNSNPEAALLLLASVSNDDAKVARMLGEPMAIASRWAETDLESALDWAKQPQSRANFNFAIDMAKGEICETWAEIDPESAITWAIQVSNDPDSSSINIDNVAGIVATWVKSDPQGAVNWAIQEFNNQPNVNSAVSLILIHWRILDPSGEKAWLVQQQSRRDILGKKKEFVDRRLKWIQEYEQKYGQTKSEKTYEEDEK